ncbi:hypothetical protein ACFLS9_06555 [Bacteroidota bacterium]
METFTGLKSLVSNPLYKKQRENTLRKIEYNTIDKPIVNLIRSINELTFCFTLQCCYGHFLHGARKDHRNLDPLPKVKKSTNVVYRIAYLALCLEENIPGEKLLQQLENTTLINPEYIQFGCADWFWKKQVNSYALQVAPKKFMFEDKFTINFQQALIIEKIKKTLFTELGKILWEMIN